MTIARTALQAGAALALIGFGAVPAAAAETGRVSATFKVVGNEVVAAPLPVPRPKPELEPANSAAPATAGNRLTAAFGAETGPAWILPPANPVESAWSFYAVTETELSIPSAAVLAARAAAEAAEPEPVVAAAPLPVAEPEPASAPAADAAPDPSAETSVAQSRSPSRIKPIVVATTSQTPAWMTAPIEPAPAAMAAFAAPEPTTSLRPGAPRPTLTSSDEPLPQAKPAPKPMVVASLPPATVATVIDPTDVGEPRRIPREAKPWMDLIRREARANGVPIWLGVGVTWVESKYDPKLRGTHTVLGMMQVMPSTARYMGYKGTTEALFDPETNVKWGMKELGWAWRKSNGDVCLAIAKYKGGIATKTINFGAANYCSQVKRVTGMG